MQLFSGAGSLKIVRALGIALLFAATQVLTASAQTPRREGNYRTADGKSTSWQIDGNHTLVWNGQRYTPVGLRVDGTPAAVDAANEAGVKDILIDLPVSGRDWAATIAKAEANGQRYVVRLVSLAPGAPGVAVDPAAYRISGLRGPKHIDLAMPGVSQALVVVALKKDSTSILNATSVATKDGRLIYDTKVHPDLETVVLIYLKTERLDIPDFWEGLDEHRDALLAQLRRAHFGPGLRGIINPLGKVISLPSQENHGVPSSAAFQTELAGVLERQYSNVLAAMNTWSLSASALSTYVGTGPEGKGTLKTTFMDLARLVPLWSGASRGVSQLWDPQRDRIFICEKTKSSIWKDINQAIALAATRRMERLCSAIRQVVDVPVVQEWTGWAGVTEDRESAFDGIAAQANGESTSELIGSAARAVSTVSRWSTKGWLVATDVTVPTRDLNASLNDLADMGLKAAFVQGPAKEVGVEAVARAANAPADTAIEPLFFPENAANPARVGRLSGGRYWLPTPEDGNRLDFGNQFFGYRMLTPKGSQVVIWAKTPGRYLLRMIHPELALVTALDGSNPDPKKGKTGLTVTLSDVPTIIEGPNEIPIPELAMRETLGEFSRLMQIAEAKHRVGTEEAYAFSQAAATFDGNPGGSFAIMRTQLRHFAVQLSPLIWIEAETTRDTTFSEGAAVPGASADQALVLRALLPPDQGFTALYNVPVTNKEEVVMWVSAKLSPERRSELEAVIGGQVLTATESPISTYGSGFAWYRLGSTHFSGGVEKVLLRMRSGVGAEAAIDSIVFAPSGWRPSGVAYPYDVITG